LLSYEKGTFSYDISKDIVQIVK